MALKRYLVQGTDGVKMDAYATTVMERGGMCFHATGAFLPEMDAATNIVSYPATVSGRVPAGILLHTTENYDTTRVPKNEQNQDIVPLNSKVAYLIDGEVITNKIAPARLASIVPGKAYVTNSGLFTDTLTGADVDPVSARFKSGPSADGYVKVSVNMA